MLQRKCDVALDRTGLYRKSVRVIVRISVSGTELDRALGPGAIPIPILNPVAVHCHYLGTGLPRALWERNWKS